MFVDSCGLNLSNTELRFYLVLKQGLLNWQCYYNICSLCRLLKDEDGTCLMGIVKENIDDLFRGLVL